MKRLTESKNFVITFEYEKVFLIRKQTGNTIFIGEFYGDPTTAIISSKEDFCAIGGEGVIVYYLNEPFFAYNDGEESAQWKTWGRDDIDQIVWVDKIEQIDGDTIKVTSDNKDEYIISI